MKTNLMKTNLMKSKTEQYPLHFLAFFALLFSSLLSHAEIREIRSMREILPFVTSKTVVIFDIDNTVVEAAQTLGSDQFFEFLVSKAKAQGLVGEQVITWALERATFVQPTSPVRPVEESTPRLIDALQKGGVPTAALTARPILWANQTVGQVRSVGVDFRRSQLYQGDLPFGPDQNGRNNRGILFMPKGGDKGIYLRDFIARSGLKPQRVIFVDDKQRNVQSVDTAFNQDVNLIEHFEFRYGAADPRVAAFDALLAEFEWNYFSRFRFFLPDAIAYQMMNSRNE